MPHNDSNAPMLPSPPCVSNEDLHVQINEVKTAVNEVRSAVIGNPKYGHRGLATRMEAVEGKVETHDRKIWLAGVILSLAWTLALFLKDFVTGSK